MNNDFSLDQNNEVANIDDVLRGEAKLSSSQIDSMQTDTVQLDMQSQMNKRFLSPQEEIAFLRNRIIEKKKAAENMPREFKIEEHADSAIREYKESSLNKVIEDKEIYTQKVEGIVKSLGQINTQKQVVELAGIMLDKGVKVAIDIAKKLQRPEIEDDFHRFLITYLLSGHQEEFKDLSKHEWKALHLKLFEIVPPHYDPVESAKENRRDPKSSIAMMEQLYAALQMIANDPENSADNYYSLEIALSQNSNEVIFYIAVPSDIEAILEKTLQGYFPGIEVLPHAQDYNIFNDQGYQVGAYAKTTENAALPLKTYKNIEGDPITVIMNSFTKLQEKGEGASMQILVRPVGDTFKKEYGNILNNMHNMGDSFENAIKRESFWGGISLAFKDAKKDDTKKKEEKKNYQDNNRTKLLNEKVSSTILDTNLRIFASADSLERANVILNDLKASFKQYVENDGNSLTFENFKSRELTDHTHNFTYRLWDKSQSLPLNLSELATLYHIPGYVKEFNQMKVAKMSTAPAPLDLPKDGVLLGYNEYRGTRTPVHLEKEARVRHLYVIGQTGTGKTVILKNLIIQDIKNGDGCCFIDPHGDDVMEILGNVPPERYDDVIYFDPAHAARPMGLNMLEYDLEFPEMKTMVINELLSIFDKLFDMKTSGGAGFEAMFRNATQLVMEHPASGNTLLEISRVLSDKDFRDYKLSKCKNPMIHQYWKNAEATSGEQSLANWVPYINSKIDPFLTNDIMRPVVAQEQSAFNIREIMDKKKIFLVNLSKGKLGEKNANLIGLILLGKFAQAALSRVNSPKEQRPDFYLYLDEFQNVVTPSISSILSEARKYRLSLNMAHQFLGQLPEDIKGAVFGNVGNMCICRVGPDDAQFLEKQYAPVFTASDIMKIENLNTYAKILSRDKPQKPFSLRVPFNDRGNSEVARLLKEMSFTKYGRPRDQVEEEIMNKYNV